MTLKVDSLSKHEAIVQYIENKGNKLSPGVFTLYRRVLGYFFTDTFPDLTPGEIRAEHVREFLDRLDERGLKYASKRRYLEALSSFFNYALRQEEFEDINGNPPAIELEEYPRYPK